MVKRLTKEHLCTTHGHRHEMEIEYGRGESGDGWRWGRGEKARLTVIAQTIKKVYKNIQHKVFIKNSK